MTTNPAWATIVLALTSMGCMDTLAMQAGPSVITMEPRVIVSPEDTMTITVELSNPFNEDVVWIGYLSTGERSESQLQTVVINVPMAPFQPAVTLGPYSYPNVPNNYRLRPHVVTVLFLNDDRYNWEPPNPAGPWQWQTALQQAQDITNSIIARRAQHDTYRTLVETNRIALIAAVTEGELDTADSFGAQIRSIETSDTTLLNLINSDEVPFAQGLVALAGAGMDGGLLCRDLVGFEFSDDEELTYVEREEEDEESQGLYVGINSDDDNANGVSDAQDITVAQENDLLPAWWFYGRPVVNLMDLPAWGSLAVGTTATQGMALWGESTKSTTPSLVIGDPASCDRVYIECNGMVGNNIRAQNSSGPAAGQDIIRLLGAGITTVRWQDTDILPTRLFEGGNFNDPGGDRWHPDKLQPGAGFAPGVFLRLRVRVEGADRVIPIYAKSYDVDDPSVNEDVDLDNRELDPGTSDNLGKRNDRYEGYLRYSDDQDSIATGWAGGANVLDQTTYFEFEPTHCPGDNFRIAVSLNRKDLVNTPDKFRSAPDAWDPTHDPTASIFTHIPSGPLGNMRAPLVSDDFPATLKQSPLLTVWRYLHVEEDIMLDPMGIQNIKESQTIDVVAHPTIPGASVITLDVDCELDDTDQYGEYIWETPFPQGIVSVYDYDLQVWRDFSPIGNTTGIAPIVIVMDDELGPPPVQSPITLCDDDDDSLTRWPLSGYLTYCRDVYRSVSVDVLVDGGGDSANNTLDMPFIRNIFDASDGLSPTLMEVNQTPGARQSHGNRGTYYWIAYVQCGWQGSYAEDLDPNTQTWTWGQTNMVTGGSAIYAESCRDLGELNMWNEIQIYNDWAHTVCHEIGHQFGIEDEDETDLSIMGANSLAPNANRFLPRHAKMIREQQAVENKPIATP